MITYIFQHDKSLVQSVGGTVFQGENLIDKIIFIFPKEYEGNNMTEFKYYLRYVTLDNKIHNELLSIDNPDYKDKYMTFKINVDSKIATFADDIKFKIIVTKNDTNILYTSDAILKVKKVNIEYVYGVSGGGGDDPTPAGNVPNGLAISSNKKNLQLTRDGIPFGTSVSLEDVNDGENIATEDERIRIIEI